MWFFGGESGVNLDTITRRALGVVSVWFFGGESGVNLDTITSSAVPVHGLQTRRAGRWKTIAEACAPCRGAGGGGANGLEKMLEYMNIVVGPVD